MHPTLRNVLAVVVGVVVGSVVNMAIVTVGPSVIPLPEGADVSTMEGLAASMKLFSPINFLPPFLAHALGTLTGAIVAAKLAVSNHRKVAMVIGGLFLLGGISAVNMFGGPMWFAVADLALAYLPMGYLGGRIARGNVPDGAAATV